MSLLPERPNLHEFRGLTKLALYEATTKETLESHEFAGEGFSERQALHCLHCPFPRPSRAALDLGIFAR